MQEMKAVIRQPERLKGFLKDSSRSSRGDHYVIPLGNFRFLPAPETQIVSLTESEVENV
jgi:hypothetical protein